MKKSTSILYLAFLTLALCVPAAALALQFTGNVKITQNVTVAGSLVKGSGTFRIDHPLDPANKLLFHSFVESPDVKNLYDGIAILDENGVATIQLPDYFLALNKSFRYQFFALDGAMPDLHVREEIKENRFTIAGGTPGGSISWQVTGIRHDPYILKYPLIVEVWKGPGEEFNRGVCYFEPLCE